MNDTLLARLSVITDEEKRLRENPANLDYTAYGSAKQLLEVDAARLLQSGRLTQIRPHTRFVHFPPHTHNFVEMVYMCAGETTHIVDGTTVKLKQGELLLLAPKAVQEILPAGEQDIAVNFIILPALFDKTLEMFAGEQNRIVDFLVGCLSTEHNPVSYLHFAVTDNLPIQNLLENLIWTLLHDEPNRRRIRENTMGLLMMQLANAMDSLVGEDSDKHRFSAAVLRYVDSHYKDGSLAELSTLLNMHFSAVSKRITRQFHCTFKDLLQEKRLQKAAALLRTTKLAVGDIILSVGYENTSYFFRLFKEKYGVSPTHYRKQAQLVE